MNATVTLMILMMSVGMSVMSAGKKSWETMTAKMTTLLNVTTNASVTGMMILAGMDAMSVGMKQTTIGLKKRTETGMEKRVTGMVRKVIGMVRKETGTARKVIGMVRRETGTAMKATSTTVTPTAGGMTKSVGRSMTVASGSSEP